MINNKCKICSENANKVFNATLLDKYDVQYFQCENCGMLFTERPYWLDEAYEDSIARADTGIIQRNLYLSRIMASFLFLCLGKKDGIFLDAAGGYGIFTRIMRDIGFDYYWSDKYTSNFMARGFEDTQNTKPYDCISLFEVLEHVEYPIEFLEEIISQTKSDTLVLTTELYSGSPPPTDEWRYYSLITGQHISFYRIDTLAYIANKLGLNFYSSNNFHVLTKRNFRNVFIKLTTSRLNRLFYYYVRSRMASKIFTDHDMFT